MGKKKTPAAPSPAPGPPQPPQLYEAMCGPGGSVQKGAPLTRAQAEAMRQADQDVVVCGPDHRANRRLAAVIEQNANGTAKRCPPHKNAGPRALPHYQPDPRPPAGHTFYETEHRQAT